MSKTVLITGASSGIGRATAVRLAAKGHTVFAAARRLDRLESLAEEAQGRIVPVELDVRDAESISRAAEAVRGHAPDGVDVVVNNAGYSLIGPIETLAAADIRDQFETNLLGLIEVTRAFLPQMRARRSGRVVNVSSVLGRLTVVGTGVYGGTKYAVEAISDALRLELAGFGIDVVVVEPGFTSTEIDTGKSAGSASIDDYAALEQGAIAYTDAQRKVTPEAVAAVLARAVETRRPRARYVVPRRFAGVLAALGALPTRWADRIKLRLVASAA